jgi:sodium transport system permease protein
LSWRDVWVLYVRELRSATRERAIVVNSILMPIFLYPVMLWLMFTGITFVEGLAEGFTSRVVVAGAPAGHAELMDTLRAVDDLEIQDSTITREDALAAIGEGELDALVEFLPAGPGARALEGNFRVSVHYDRSIERSRRALDRVEATIDRYRERLLERQATGLGISPEQLEVFRVDQHTVSTQRDMGALILSEMIPLFLVIMVAFGCLYPAIDATAGERERSTWETLMTVSASRMSVVTAKYFYVATLGTVAGILNVLAMFVSIGAVLQPLMARETGAPMEFSFPALAVPLMLAGALVLGLFFAAAMMILAAFARTFKEGQAMITPIFWLVFLPLMLGSSPDRTLSPTLALLPVGNVAQMIKDAIRGIYLWPLIVETLLVEVALVALCLLAARFVLRFEDFLLGSFDGSFWKFLRARLGSRREVVEG